MRTRLCIHIRALRVTLLGKEVVYFISGGGGERGLSPRCIVPRVHGAPPPRSEHAEHLLEPEQQLPVLLGDVLLEELLERVDALARDAAVDGVGQVRSGLGSGLGFGLGLALGLALG